MATQESSARSEITRRRFMGYLLAAPVVVAAVDLGAPAAAEAEIPTVQPVDFYDLSDLLNDAALATSALIKVTVNTDGTVSFALPRAEVGQGITTAFSMIIAEEMSVPLDKVRLTLADATPDLVWNQLTGGSNSVHSLYDQLRMACAIARGQLAKAAATALEAPLPSLSISNGAISFNGQSLAYGVLTTLGAVTHTQQVLDELKPPSEFTLIGTPQGRVDALEAVTGTKTFAMNLQIPGALPTMLCRAPTINGSAVKVNNADYVKKQLPGITDIVIVPHSQRVPGGVAIRADTFGTCIDAIQLIDVTWADGPVANLSEADVQRDLIAAELPMTPAPLLTKTLDQRFTFHFRPGNPLEPNCAVADVRPHGATIWSSMKSPIYAQERIAEMLGMPISAVTCHVTQGGGSFGRHLFADGAFEAAAVSKLLGKPVKLMWHQVDSFRQGRTHPMCTSRVRMSYGLGNVLSYDQRHTSVQTDFSHGLGELLSSTLTDVPAGNYLAFSQSVFLLTANNPYNFGPSTQLLNEIYKLGDFNTSSVRNIYSPEVTTSRELMVDQLAKQFKQDPMVFRKSYARDARMVAVLDKVAEAASWGSPQPGNVQGVGVHHEYKGFAACVVELDLAAASRQITEAYTGPRVTKVTFVVDVGLPINPLGLQAQMLGGTMDGIAQVLSYSLHLEKGAFLESSWDDCFYTREWNTPPEVNIIVMPANTTEPGGAGELGVAAAMAATANAYARATGKLPTSFPVNHDSTAPSPPLPYTPSVPQSPTDGTSQDF